MTNVMCKSRKDLKLFVLFISLTVVFTSCARKKPFEFLHDTSEIVKIEIVDFGCLYEGGDFNDVIRASYQVEDIDAFLSDFKAADFKQGVAYDGQFDNSRAIKIVYSNGDYEFISVDVKSLTAYDDYEDSIGWFYNNEQFVELLEKYSPPRDSGDITVYSFMYPESEIVKIELVDVSYRHNRQFPISEKAAYPIEDTESFLSDFREVECRTGGWAKWDKLIDSEARMIKISYAHGEYEYIDVDGYLQHRYYYTVEQSENYLTGPDSKCFNIEQFSALIEKYSP